jgi:hypothetical protein
MRYKEFKKAVEYLEAKNGKYPTIKDLKEFISRMN